MADGTNDDPEKLPLRYCFLTSAEKTEFNSQTDTTHEFLTTAAKAVGIGVDVEQQRDKYYEAKSRRSSEPINEFTNGQLVFLGGWLDLFMLGQGFGTKNTLSDSQMRHILQQYSNMAAKCRLFIFYLFDKMQRHCTIRSLSAKISKDKEAFEKFTKIFLSNAFQCKLHGAISNPDGSDAKYILNKLVPILTQGSKSTPFGVFERRSAAGEILAMGNKYGPGSNFLTASIDDPNSPGVMRLCFRSCDNLNFPAMCEDDLLKAMEIGGDYTYQTDENAIPDITHCVGSGTVKIPCNWSSLAMRATDNPLAVAAHYKQLIHNLLTILVGIKPATVSGDNRRTVTTHYRGWGENSLGAISGTPAAFIGTTETTG